MATEATVQVIPTSADVAGMSVVTASRNQNTNRAGLIYNLSTLAAAAPVWFHPMPGGEAFLTLFAKRITNATLADRVSPRGVLLYGDGTFATDPTWAVISTATGSMDNFTTIPSEQPGIRSLVSAFSRGDYLFTLNRYQTSADAQIQSLLQVFRVGSDQGITLLGEEIVPLAFRLGLYVDRRYLWVFGASGGNLGLIRKNWAKIGISPDAATTSGWQYWGKNQWNDDANFIDSLSSKDGPIPAQGPCSMARYRDTYYLVTTAANRYNPTNPTVAPTVVPVTDTQARRRMFPILRSIMGLLGGILRGFVRIGSGVVSLITNLFRKLVEAVTGIFPDSGETEATPKVLQFLRAITGYSIPGDDENFVDPAVQLEDIIRAITDTTVAEPTETEVTQGFLDSVVATTAGQPITDPDTEPIGWMEQLIRNVTGHTPGTSIVSDINSDGVEDTVTSWTNPAPVKAVANTNVTVALPGKTVAGVTVAVGDLVYLNGQNVAAENGLYTYRGEKTAMTPTTDTFKVLTPLTPEVSWKAVAYSSRAVEEKWTKHGFSHDLAATTRLYHGGVHLQEQIPLAPGFGVIAASAGVSLLDEFSNTTQVITGTSPHTVILPATAKPVGSSVTTEGVVEIPFTPIEVAPILTIEDAQITEGNLGPKVVKFRVSLDKATTKTVVVSYATFDATATGGNSDYKTVTGVLTFTPGIISQDVGVTVYGDNTYELVNVTDPDTGLVTGTTEETFTVELFDPVNATIGDDTATCTIVNDDSRTLIESLLEDLKNIFQGLVKGALRVGSILVNTVVTILKQTVSTMTTIVQETGQLLYSMVDAFLRNLSGGRWDLPGDFGTPAENFADILELIGNGVTQTIQAVRDFAVQWFETIKTSVSVLVRGVVTIFQRMVQAVKEFLQIGGGSGVQSFALMSVAGGESVTTDGTLDEAGAGAYAMALASSETVPAPVAYLPYTIHNQSTADIVVMTSGRDKAITVPHGSGYVFTPYNATPTLSSSWSWTYASERAPRIRQGFPFLHTRALTVNTYHLVVEGQPGAGTFRLSHNGKLTVPITYVPGNPVGTQANIQTAMADLTSITAYTVTPDEGADNAFTITVTDDCGYLNAYSYRLLNGAPTPVLVTPNNGPSQIALTGPPDVRVRVYKKYTITFAGNPTGGQFTLSYNGVPLTAVTYNTTLTPVNDLLGQPLYRVPAMMLSVQEILNDQPQVQEVVLGSDSMVAIPGPQDPPPTPPTPGEPVSYTLLVATAANTNTLVLDSQSLTTTTPDSVPQVTVTDESDFTLLTAWSALEPNPQPAAASGLTKAEADATTTSPDTTRLPALMTQLSALLNAVADNNVKVGLGLVDTTSAIIVESLFIITGKEPIVSRSVTNLIIEFLQELYRQGEVTTAAAISFENILRQLTGGTGLTGEDDPTLLNFVQNVFQASTNLTVNLADWLRRIVRGILTR